MNYKLNKQFDQALAGAGSSGPGTARFAPTVSTDTNKTNIGDALRRIWPLLKNERWNLLIAAVAIGVNSWMNLYAPILVGHAVDNHIVKRDFNGVLMVAAQLLGVYLVALVASYIQTRVMGGVGQRTLFRLRNVIFTKLQELPLAFFNQNKAGDLISRINNDTDKLNQFFSQSLMQFIGSIFIMIGAAVSVISLHTNLGLASLAPALVVLVVTRLLTPWVKKKNAVNLRSVGGMSAEISESLHNFKVIVAFDRSDYFREQFETANKQNYETAVRAGLANNLFTPLYSLASMAGQLIVLTYGIQLILDGHFTLGLLISFFTYINRFYDPLRQLASLWTSFQVALAGWDRVSEILTLESDLKIVPARAGVAPASHLLEFRGVDFGYPEGKQVLKDINFTLERGKTYAFVGPTGGGKTTTASLIARLYDPTKGDIFFEGRDLRSYTPAERTQKIGFILQEPYLFAGTIRDNLMYGSLELQGKTPQEFDALLKEVGLDHLLARFEKGLDAEVTAGESMSLGQKQIIAFMRAVLRKPDLLILDEATANIDTVTERVLDDILKRLPTTTTRVIIAHRLNTIEGADEIFFVNGGAITRAGSLDHAVEMLLHGKRQS